MGGRREHFKIADIQKLKERVNHQCSRPECKAPTSGPGSGQSVVTVGTAAHICAASPKGPRYDPQQSRSDRNNIANAIWLCNNCAREIDLDPKKFTVELLHQWKNSAEMLATSQLGKRLISSDDNMKSLAAALTGYSPSILWDSINKIHGATTRVWEALDPRFYVLSSYQNGIQTIELHAKEMVSLQLTIQPEFLKNFAEKRKFFLQQGKSVEVDLTGFSISGSRLLESLMDLRNGKLVMSPLPIESRLKVYLYDSESRLVDMLDDVIGETTVGTEIFNFQGGMLDGLFKINFSHPIDGIHQRLNINISLALDRWVGRKLNELPYFTKAYSLFKYLYDGYHLILKMEVLGESVFTTNISSFEKENFIRDQFWFLSYMEICRKLINLLKVNAYYKEDVEFSWEAYDEHEVILSRLEKKREFKTNNLKKNITCEMTLPVDNHSLLESNFKNPMIFQIEYPGDKTIIFGEKVDLPPLIISISNVVPNIVRVIYKNEIEARFEVEFIPSDGFLYSETYEIK